MVSINEEDDSVHAVAIMWLDKNHQFFVGNAEPTTSEDPLYRVRWRQVTEQSDNLDPELAVTLVPLIVTTSNSKMNLILSGISEQRTGGSG